MSNDCTLSRLKVSPQVYCPMYSLAAVGGIQYTTDMVKNKNKGSSPKQNYVFKGLSEMICINAGASTVVPAPLDANSTTTVALTPIGCVSWKLTSGPTATLSSVVNPVLKWMQATSTNFKEYRVLRATVRIVGNVPSTSAGNFTVVSSKNYADIFSGATPNYANSGAGTSVASLATKDQRFPLIFDSTWKPVTSRLVAIGTDQVTVVPLNNIDTASFCSFAVSNNSTVALGIMYLDYDVEFRGPINPTLNA